MTSHFEVRMGLAFLTLLPEPSYIKGWIWKFDIIYDMGDPTMQITEKVEEGYIATFPAKITKKAHDEKKETRLIAKCLRGLKK